MEPGAAAGVIGAMITLAPFLCIAWTNPIYATPSTRVEVVQSRLTRRVDWAGEHLMVSGDLRLTASGQNTRTWVRFWDPDSIGDLPLSSLALAGPAGSILPIADQLFWTTADGELVAADLTGTPKRRWQAHPEGAAVVGAFPGTDAVYLMTTDGSETRLWSDTGKQLGSFELDGKTPTIIRAYTGFGSHHNNILQESSSWPVSWALTPDASVVAIGGSDSVVRLFDGAGGGLKELAYEWDYEERRMSGGNPDLNRPLALRFIDDGDTLLAAYGHGDIIHWDTASGTAKQHFGGGCAAEEAHLSSNRYRAEYPDIPEVTPTEEEVVKCGYASDGAVSADGAWVATQVGAGIRIRSGRTGASEGLFLNRSVGHMTFGGHGRLALSTLYGAVSVWRAGEDSLDDVLPAAEPQSPVTPQISPDGRYLYLNAIAEHFVWDMVEKRRVLTTEIADEVLAFSELGTHVVQRTERGIVLRDLVAGSSKQLASPEEAGTWTGYVQLVGHDFALARVYVDGDYGLRITDLSKPDRVFDLKGRTGRTLLSPDGRSVAVFGEGLRLVDVSTGKVSKTFAEPKRHVRVAHISPDGAWIAWTEQHPDTRRSPDDPPRDPAIVVHHQSLLDRSKHGEFEMEAGWPAGIYSPPDGSEALLTMEDGRFIRWDLSTYQTQVNKGDGFHGSHAAVYTPDLKHLLVTGYDRLLVHRLDNTLTHLATVEIIDNGEWVARSASGAMDSTEAALGDVLTAVDGLEGTHLSDHQLGWTRYHVPGVYERALRGLDTPLPRHKKR